MKKPTLKEKINYSIDKYFSNGLGKILGFLVILILIVTAIVSFIIVQLNISNGFINVFWDLISTTINAYMPEFDSNIPYLIIETISAIIGLLFTSFLIGSISSIIGEKLKSVRKGKIPVIENKHTIVLGFDPSSLELINQLIEAAHNSKKVIVICEEMDREVMENIIYSNISVPDNIKLICRNIDLLNPLEMELIYPQTAKNIIVNVMDDNRAVMVSLAVLAYMKDYPDSKTRIISSVSDCDHLLPESFMKPDGFMMFSSDELVSRLIAHTSTEPGLDKAYKEIIDYHGNELYVEKTEGLEGKSINDLCSEIDKAVIVGILRNEEVTLNPSYDTVIEKDDKLILLEEYKKAYELCPLRYKDIAIMEKGRTLKSHKGKLVIFGYSYKLETILKELTRECDSVVLADYGNHKDEILELIIENNDLNISFNEEDVYDDSKLNELINDAEHIIIIKDETEDSKEDDVDNILLELRIIEQKLKHNYDFNITTELQLEKTYKLAINSTSTSFIIRNNIVSMLLVQLAENRLLFKVLRELLSNEGNELYIKYPEEFNLKDSDYSISTLKQIILSYGYTLIGTIEKEQVKINHDNRYRVYIDDECAFIVMGLRG
ncbi:MAG: hypothetical protein Q4D13_05560 [Erysipelotrichaceae bacterium]|nr:hypothetical protein [Erysipelotrichaceae bacterium]